MEVKKFVALFTLLMLLAPMALATVTVTVNTGLGRINNLPANVRDYDINFTVTDDNATWGDFREQLDLNINIGYYPVSGGDFDANVWDQTMIVTDGNLNDWNANPTGGAACSGNDWATFTCNYTWRIPSHTTLGQGSYLLDINVMDWTAGASEDVNVNEDANGEVAFQIDNTLGSGAIIRSMISTMALVLIGVAIIGGLLAVFAFKADPAAAATMVVIGTIAVGIVAWIAGAVLVTL